MAAQVAETLVERGRLSRIIPTSMNPRLFLLLAATMLGASGCLSVKTEPIEVKPIHVTVDVNVKVDRALDSFFGDLDQKSATLEKPAAQP